MKNFKLIKEFIKLLLLDILSSTAGLVLMILICLTIVSFVSYDRGLSIAQSIALSVIILVSVVIVIILITLIRKLIYLPLKAWLNRIWLIAKAKSLPDVKTCRDCKSYLEGNNGYHYCHKDYNPSKRIDPEIQHYHCNSFEESKAKDEQTCYDCIHIGEINPDRDVTTFRCKFSNSLCSNTKKCSRFRPLRNVTRGTLNA